jgi:hypothetical protein
VSEGPSGEAVAGDLVLAIDGLLELTHRLEARLEAESETRAHDWMFALREILLDQRRLLPQLAALADARDLATVPAQLRELAVELLEGAQPHARHHLDELLESLDS